MQFLVLSLLLLSIDGLNSFRCLLFKESCRHVCPSHMHAYHTRCDRDTVSQRTCAFPYIYNLGHTCGWSRCDCNGDLVLDETTWVCVEQLKCEPAKGRRRGRKFKARTHRPRLTDNEDIMYELM